MKFVCLALIGATSAVKIRGACTWSQANGIGPAGCYNGSGECGSETERLANAASTGLRSRNPIFALHNFAQTKSQGACKWTAATGIGPAGCYNGTGRCGNETERLANAASTNQRSCDPNTPLGLA